MDANLEFELRPVVLALGEERHPVVLTAGFQASLNWLNKLMAQHMQLPMRTLAMPTSLMDGRVAVMWCAGSVNLGKKHVA